MLSIPTNVPGRTGHSFSLPNAATCFLYLGLVLRTVHYLWNHTIWYDEAVLLSNVLGKGYARLLGPLDYEVAAPPIFLWALRSTALVLGDHPYVWRFPPFAISCLTLILMAALARRVLPATPAALLVGLVAFSDGFVWLGCNVKPYILDACVATGILYAYTLTEAWTPVRRIGAFAALAPLLLCTSYPALFLYLGLLLAFLPDVWRRGQVAPWAAYLGLAAAVLGTSACLYLGPIKAQRVSGLVAGWMNKFPDLARPATVPGWVAGNTFLVFHYCYNPIGAVCVFFAGAGVWQCLRNRRADLACVCLGPLAACLLAACAHAYPYSNNRLILFAAPGVGLMTGLGVSALIDCWRCHARRAALVLGVLLIAPEVGLSLLHLYAPWDKPDAAGTTRFVEGQRRPDDLIATEGGTYSYFFFGEVRPLAEAAAQCGAGQRVWVLLDHSLVEKPRESVLSAFGGPEWELRSEMVFHRASVYLLVRSDRDEVAWRNAEE